MRQRHLLSLIPSGIFSGLFAGAHGLLLVICCYCIDTDEIPGFFLLLRACLHGVGDPSLVGWFLLLLRSGGHKTKETYPTRRGPQLHVNRV